MEVRLGLHRDNGKENGIYNIILDILFFRSRVPFQDLVVTSTVRIRG